MWEKERKGVIEMKKAETIKDLVNSLDPNPISTDENMEHFFVDTSEARGADAIAKIEYLLKNGESKNKKFLFAGHAGSGKSTELFKMTERLKEQYTVIYLSISDYVSFLDMSTVDVIYAIFKKMVEKCQELGIKVREELIKNILSYWQEEAIISQTTEEELSLEGEMEVGASLFHIISSRIKSFFQQSYKVKCEKVEKAEKSLPQFISFVNIFLKDFKDSIENKEILIIVDDLDKMAEKEACDIFKEHTMFLTSINANIIYTFPVFMHYNPNYRYIMMNFDESVILSIIMINQKNGIEYDKGIETLETIVKKRANENLFESDVILFAIRKSGGSIRNVLNLLRTASINAGMRYESCLEPPQKKLVTMADVGIAYRDYKNAMQRLINRKHLAVLKDIYKCKRPISDEDNSIIMELFKTFAVIEYNCDRWCDLNPAVKDYLVEVGELEAEELK